MENKFFMHRIERRNGTYSSGIEVHDTADAAILSFHSRMKLAYNNPSAPDVDFMSCEVMNPEGSVIRPYSATWHKSSTPGVNAFFVHYIRHDGDNYAKGIDTGLDYDAALRALHTYAEYGHDNSKFPDITYTYAAISDMTGAAILADVWVKPDPEPEPEPTPDPEPEPEEE